jgi:tRNA (guanine-N(7)-)-methyltransferase subunit TRM82
MFAQVICRRSNGDSSIHAREVILLLAANRFHLFDLSDGTAINDATERHHERRILAAALSPCTHYVASSCEAKQLKLFTDLPDGQWHLHKHWDLPKRVYTLHFTQGSQKIVVADRSGDVYRCSLGVDDDDKELLLGHVSMITDLLMTPDERYIITADQDEKIRVTNYPHTFDIHNFCLGHEW